MQRILIIGGGFAGMWAALGAARARADAGAAGIQIDLVSRDPRLVLRPRLYERNPDRLTVDLPPLLDAVGARFIAGEVTRIGAAAVTLSDGQVLPFDRLVLAAGSVTPRPDIPGFDRFGLVLDTLDDRTRLYAHLDALPPRAPAAVIGAGFTGIEIATELAPERPVTLIDRLTEVGASLGGGPRPAIIAALDQLGVTRHLGVAVRALDDAGVRLQDGTHVAAAAVIWAGGLAANPLAALVPGTRDASGRLVVEPTLRLPDAPAVFAAGDVAGAEAAPGHNTLLSCQHAMPTGRIAGHNAVRSLVGAALVPYAQPAYTTCLDLGAAGAVLSVGWGRRVIHTGADAKLVKRTINGMLIVPPDASKPDALLAAAAIDTGRPTDEAGLTAWFERLIAARRVTAQT